MKKTLGLFLVLFVGIQQLVYAQTGIGTNSPNDQAVLEIQSVDKGVLFPSISLTSTTTFLGGISATASHTNMLVYNTNTATTTTGLDGAGYYFWNGSNWEKITGDTDGQSLAEVTAIGSSTFDVIQVGGIFDIGDLTVNGESSLQGDVRLGVSTGQTVTVNGLVDTNILFFGPGRDIASTATPVTNVYGQYIKPGSGNDLDLDTNDSSNRITFSNDTNIKAGVNSSTLFVGDDAGPNHYKFPSGTASRSPDQVLSLDSSSEQLTFTTLLRLPTATNDGATLRWDSTGNEWQESTDLRIAPNSSSEVWINQSLLPSSTLLDIGQSGNNFDEVYADQLISSQGSVTFGTSNGSAKVNLKFDGDPSGSLVLNERNAIAGQNNTAFGYQTFNTAGTVGNNNVAIGHSVLSSSTGTGGNNVGIGTSALQNNTANDNVAIGNEALILNSGGTQNVAVGSNVLDENTSGQYNTAVGYNALHANTTGENNIAIGKAAMADNITGQKNIIIGTGADVGASDLENAIAIGYGATVNSSNTLRLGNDAISSIISSGTLTLDGVTYPNTTGTAGQVLTVSSTTENLYFSTIPTLPASFDDGATLRWNLSATEWEATTDFRIAPGTGYSLPNAIWIEESIIPSSTINLGQSGNEFNQTYTEEIRTSTNVLALTTNAQSVFLKRNTLNFSLTNDQDPFPVGFKGNIGFGVGVFNTTATTPNNNIAVGYNVLEDLTTGSSNVAFGSGTLNDITSGGFNVVMGNSAGNDLTTASQTVIIGDNAGALLTGSNNIAVGYRAMYGSPSSTGYDNIGVGNHALRRVANAYDNVALGHDSMGNLTTGNNNVAVGDNSMNSVTTGSNNIAIGDGALNTLTIGSGNIAIGENADVNGTSTTNAIAIGKDAEVEESNSIRLGNTNISSIISSGTLTLDGVTYPNTTGTAGQVLTVSSTTDILYFADASSSTTPTLAEVTTQGSITTNELQVGGMTVSGTIGLTIGESASQYKLPTRRGSVGQSLVVSTTSNQLVFSSPAYFLGDISGSTSIDLSKLSSSPPFEEVGDFQLVETDSSETITITTQNEDDDTFKLPAGKSFKLTSYISFDSPSTSLQYRFYNHTESKMIGLEGFVSVNNYVVPAVAFVEASSSDVEISIVVINAGASSGNETVDNDFTRIEIVEIK